MFDPAVFAARRDAYMRALGPNADRVRRPLPGRLRIVGSSQPFRPITDLYDLAGFGERVTRSIWRPSAERERVVMFVRPRDPGLGVWDGRRASVDGAVATYGADVA